MLDRLRPSEVRASTSVPRILRVDSDAADDVIGAMSSTTARQILALLHEEPKPPSEIADSIDSSIPNVHYHLENLEDAGLVAIVDTWYSEKGNEMQVYAPADDPIVFVGTEERASRVSSLLRRLVGALGLLVVGSGLVQWLVEHVLQDRLLTREQEILVRKVAAAGTLDRLTFTVIPPGLLFFAGGTFVLALGVAWWYWTNRE